MRTMLNCFAKVRLSSLPKAFQGAILRATGLLCCQDETKSRKGLCQITQKMFKVSNKSRVSKIVQRRIIEHFVAGTMARCMARFSIRHHVYYYQRLREYLSN